VAAHVVHRFKSVQIDDERRQRLPVAQRACELFVETRVEGAHVRKAGERIGRREFVQPIRQVPEQTPEDREDDGRRCQDIRVGRGVADDFAADTPERQAARAGQSDAEQTDRGALCEARADERYDRRLLLEGITSC
jgi:hypothetical protein